MSYADKAESATRWVRAMERNILIASMIASPLALVLPTVGVYISIGWMIADLFTLGVVMGVHLLLFALTIRLGWKPHAWAIWLVTLLLAILLTNYGLTCVAQIGGGGDGLLGSRLS